MKLTETTVVKAGRGFGVENEAEVRERISRAFRHGGVYGNTTLVRLGKLLTAPMATFILDGTEVIELDSFLTVDGKALDIDLAKQSSIGLMNGSRQWFCYSCNSAHGTGIGRSD